MMNSDIEYRLKRLLKEAAELYEEACREDGQKCYEHEQLVAPTRLKQTTVDTDPWYTRSY